MWNEKKKLLASKPVKYKGQKNSTAEIKERQKNFDHALKLNRCEDKQTHQTATVCAAAATRSYLHCVCRCGINAYFLSGLRERREVFSLNR